MKTLWPLTLVLFLALQSRAQQYPDTIWIPVTFYDFHSDKSNPEFEQPHLGGVHLGMVADTLDSSRKPDTPGCACARRSTSCPSAEASG